jgi:hypothetical protein
LSIHFSPGILAFALEKKTLTKDDYKAIFEVKNSFGDVFAVTPFKIGFAPKLISLFFFQFAV